MKDRKAFDCVQMKWDIQQRLLGKFEGVNEQEVRRVERERIEADPVLGPFLQKIVLSCPSPAKS